MSREICRKVFKKEGQPDLVVDYVENEQNEPDENVARRGETGLGYDAQLPGHVQLIGPPFPTYGKGVLDTTVQATVVGGVPKYKYRWNLDGTTPQDIESTQATNSQTHTFRATGTNEGKHLVYVDVWHNNASVKLPMGVNYVFTNRAPAVHLQIQPGQTQYRVTAVAKDLEDGLLQHAAIMQGQCLVYRTNAPTQEIDLRRLNEEIVVSLPGDTTSLSFFIRVKDSNGASNGDSAFFLITP